MSQTTEPGAESSTVVPFPEQPNPNAVLAALDRAREYAEEGRITKIVITGFDGEEDTFVVCSPVTKAELNWIADKLKDTALYKPVEESTDPNKPAA